MGEAEAVDPAVSVGVATSRLDGVGAGVGAPLDHPEGRVGAGELAHRAGLTGPVPVPSRGWTSAAGSARAVAGGGSAPASEPISGGAVAVAVPANASTASSADRRPAGSTVLHRDDGSRRGVVPSGLRGRPHDDTSGGSIPGARGRRGPRSSLSRVSP